MTGHTFGRRGKSLRLAFGAAVAIVALCDARAARAEDEPKVWQQLFFPFPIVGAPPQLEQQVQLFDSYFRGNAGSGSGVASTTIRWIPASAGCCSGAITAVGGRRPACARRSTQSAR